LVWNSYASLSYLPHQSARTPRANIKSCSFGAVMNDHSQRENANPYSPLLCILLLSMTGIGVKIGAAIHLCQQSSCSLPLNW
jgi:hypothetical protein